MSPSMNQMLPKYNVWKDIDKPTLNIYLLPGMTSVLNCGGFLDKNFRFRGSFEVDGESRLANFLWSEKNKDLTFY